jgi:hypothetical protein
VANARANGKVRQETVAVLGSIDATWLESFWESAPDLARHQHWEIYSLRARTAFWQGVLDRMGAIGDNRLSKDERVAIRRAIHKVVPWVMEPEKKRLALLEAQNHFESVQFLHSSTEKMITLHEETIEHATKTLQELRAESAEEAKGVLAAGLRIAKLAESE